jgi:DNA-binding NarL/FixJ family response regulator
MTKLRVLMADDHAVVREGLKALVSAHAAMEVVGEAADGYAACQFAETLNPYVVVLDVSMPEVCGAEAAGQLRRAGGFRAGAGVCPPPYGTQAKIAPKKAPTN